MLKNHIEIKLREAFSPTYLKVVDDSHLHIGHQNYQPGESTHFSVTLVSAVFKGLTRLQQHQKVYACLEEELKTGVHALCLKTRSPQELEELEELNE